MSRREAIADVELPIQSLVAQGGGRDVQEKWRNNVAEALKFAHGMIEVAAEKAKLAKASDAKRISREIDAAKRSITLAQTAERALRALVQDIARRSSDHLRTGEQTIEAVIDAMRSELIATRRRSAQISGQRWLERKSAELAKKDA